MIIVILSFSKSSVIRVFPVDTHSSGLKSVFEKLRFLEG